jgi:hypothetical protein
MADDDCDGTYPVYDRSAKKRDIQAQVRAYEGRLQRRKAKPAKSAFRQAGRSVAGDSFVAALAPQLLRNLHRSVGSDR